MGNPRSDPSKFDWKSDNSGKDASEALLASGFITYRMGNYLTKLSLVHPMETSYMEENPTNPTARSAPIRLIVRSKSRPHVVWGLYASALH